MHQTPHFFAGRRESFTGSGTDNYIKGFSCSQMVADRTNSAKPLYEYRHFPIGTALDKTFKTAEFNDMQSRLFNFSFIVEVNGNLAMSFHPGYRFNGYLLSHIMLDLIEFDNFIR